MTTLWLALLLTGLLFGSRSAIRTFAGQMADPAVRWLVAACAIVIACGLWR
jgi:hypothetical protein